MATSTRCLSGSKRFILWCANEHNDFRIPELASLATLFKINLNWVERSDKKPYIVVDASSEDDLKKLMSRTLLVRSAYELWGQAKNHDDLHAQLKTVPFDFIKPYTDPELSFCIRVETFCKSLTLDQKLVKIDEFGYLPLTGPVKLENPDISLALLEFYGTDSNNIPEHPYNVFFGRWICNGQRDKICKISLKTRKFIGNTSMDAQLSLIMANQALVQKNSLVYDPFVGSGSLLVAASYFGGYVWGADIDYLMLHGKAKPTRFRQKKRDDNESISANLQQYKLGSHYVDAVVADSSAPLWRDSFILDAIITDPPYGIREATEKVGTKKPNEIKTEHLPTHVPSKVHYCLKDIYVDLLNFAVKHLKVGGRLVFWLPVYLADYTEDAIPRHPCLELISNSEQPLAKHSSRRLITMEKTMEVSLNDLSTANASDAVGQFTKQYFKSAFERKNYSEADRRYQKKNRTMESQSENGCSIPPVKPS